MAEEEDISVKSDVAMSTSDQPAADSEKIVPLSYEMSQHTENEGNDGSDIIESVDIAVNEGNNEQEEETFELEPEFELTELEKPIAPKDGETENVDDNASIHSDGQLTTDNEEDEMENFTQNQISNGQNFDNNGQNFNQPLNEYNGNLEYTIPQNLLREGEGLEDRLHGIRRNLEHLFNQMNIFNEFYHLQRLMDVENFDIDEFAATFLELSSLITVLRDISREFDELQEKISSVVLKCLDKYEENATVCGGHLLNAKINKSRQIRGIINSWRRSSDQLVENLNSDEPLFNDEIKSNPYYDNIHNYQILSQNITSEPTGYTYVADIPPPILPNTFFVAPTALPSFSHENVINLQNYNDETDNERTTELPTDLIPTHMAPPPISNAPERPLSHNSPSNYIPPMISLSSSSSFNTPPAMISSNILPPMNIPPPSMVIPPQNIRQPLNILPQSNIPSSDPKIILPLFQNKQNMPPKTASVLIPGLNIANTAPLFAQAPSLINNKLSEPSLIPTQLPTVTSANYGSDNYRKQNPQIAPIINMNISGMGSKSPAQNLIPQPSSSSHIPSLLSIEVPFPIEILKRNQNQAQQQRFNNRNRRSPVINSEPKESTPSKEKESQSVKSDEPMDATEQQSVTEETPDDPINDTPGLKRLLYKTVAAFYFHSMYPQVYSTDGVFVQPAIYLPIRSVNGYLTYYPHPVSSMTPPMGTPISSYYATSPLTLMSGGAVSPIPNGSIGEGPAQMRKLFIGGLNHETTDEQLREYYSQWGAVVDCIVIRDPVTKQSRGFGFVTYATIQMAEAAMNGRPHTINGKVVDPKRAIPREQMLPMTANNPPYFLEVEPQQDCKVILSGIHWDYHTVDGLRQHFETFGSVEQIEILGHPRGFGFVVFEDKDSVSRCKAHGKQHSVNGKKVEVKTDPSLDLPSAASVYSKRRHNLSGSQGYATQQHSSTATPDSICSTEYTSSDSIRSDHSEPNNLQTTPTF